MLNRVVSNERHETRFMCVPLTKGSLVKFFSRSYRNSRLRDIHDLVMYAAVFEFRASKATRKRSRI